MKESYGFWGPDEWIQGRIHFGVKKTETKYLKAFKNHGLETNLL